MSRAGCALLVGVLAAPGAACVPLESSSASLFEAHESGVVFQDSLDGGEAKTPAVESGGDSGAVRSSPPAADPVPEEAVTKPASAMGAEKATNDSSVVLSASAASGSLASETGLAARDLPPPSPGEEDVQSGEYIPPAGLVLQVPVPQGVVVGDDGSDESESSEVSGGAAEDGLPVPVEIPESVGGVDEGSGEMMALAEQSLEGVLPAPTSDQDGLEAIAALPRRFDSEQPGTGSDGGVSTSVPPCRPSGSSLLTIASRDLTMVRAWVEGGELRAELRDPDGRLYPVVLGDRVGPDGGRVVRISRNEVVVGAIGFDLDGRPVIVQEVRRLSP